MYPIIETRNLSKIYKLDSTELQVLHNISLMVEKGEFLFIMGPSGSGKTTLVNLIGGIDRATTGTITYNFEMINGKYTTMNIHELSETKLTAFRRRYLSYVFQFYSLIPTLSASENVQLMAELVGIKGNKLKQTAEYWLEIVGLKDRINSFPSQLSGGERQRVAIARAIAKNPEIILADEPTGQLDRKTGRQVVDVLHNICKMTKKTIIIVTHDPSYKDLADRILYMDSGMIVGVEINNILTPAIEIHTS